MANSCEHIARLSAEDFPPQKTPGACEECLKEGTVWVALRECQTCGVHDTRIVESPDDGQTTHICNACGARFAVERPRDA